MSEIYTYNNGIKCYSSRIFGSALERYEKGISIHEPLEEMIFNHIFIHNDITIFVDIGSAWGYYSFLAKCNQPDTKVIAFDPDEKRCGDLLQNLPLNSNSEDIQVRNEAIGVGFTTLKEVISEFGEISLIKLDIKGGATSAFKSAGDDICKIQNIVLGTHDKEHDDCLEILEANNFNIQFNERAHNIPLQPDGLIWANK